MKTKMKEQFDVNKYFEYIEEYVAKEYEPLTIKKPFYYYYEWSGWRFYKKAVLNKDWKSIIGHIKSNFGLR